jgi:predicted GH43/DUF377 family glycosyl hydrolase
MKWNKTGRIYVPDGGNWWAKKYAVPPTPYFLTDEIIRMYVGCCDENMVGRIGYVDLRADNPSEIMNVSEEPVLDIGEPGAFDENGILPTSIVEVDAKLYLYYVGYQLGMKLRYFQFAGLAISYDGGASFKRAQRVPVIDRSDQELFNRTSAFVRRHNRVFQMWYVGGSDWTTVAGKPLPVYNIRYLESADGIHWPQAGRVCIDYANEDEHAFGRPFIFEEGGSHKMFYSVRTRSKDYRIGYAESTDGQNWVRKDDEIGIDVSDGGWDSQMLAYASVVRHKDKVYMFYNGNNCGETGFGYAELEHW